MTQEDKLLLLKDLCARLPYNLYVRIEEFNIPKNEAITEGFIGNYLKDNRCNDYDADDILNELTDGCINVKPYLRPMSSMTEEERKELQKAFNIKSSIIGEYGISSNNAWWIKDKKEPLGFDTIRYTSFCGVTDYLNSIHVDYRGLIEKGLALEATKGLYKIN